MNEPKLIRLLAVMVFALAPVTVFGQSNLDPGRLPKSSVGLLTTYKRHSTLRVTCSAFAPCAHD